MRTPDVLANYPFVSSSARFGSFVGGTPEDKFMEIVWRVKTWSLTCDTDLRAFYSPTLHPTDHFTVLPKLTLYEVAAGQTRIGTSITVSEFSPEEDVMVRWRSTEVTNLNTSNGFTQSSKVFFGPNGVVREDRAFVGAVPNVAGVGVLDSYATFTAYDGDVFFPASTDRSLFTNPKDTGITVILKINGTIIMGVSLYIETPDPLGSYPDRTFTCASPIVLQSKEWWEYREVASSPATATWNKDTGAQLLDPLRFSPDNSRGRFFVQPV